MALRAPQSLRGFGHCLKTPCWASVSLRPKEERQRWVTSQELRVKSAPSSWTTSQDNLVQAKTGLVSFPTGVAGVFQQMLGSGMWQ